MKIQKRQACQKVCAQKFEDPGKIPRQRKIKYSEQNDVKYNASESRKILVPLSNHIRDPNFPKSVVQRITFDAAAEIKRIAFIQGNFLLDINHFCPQIPIVPRVKFISWNVRYLPDAGDNFDQ